MPGEFDSRKDSQQNMNNGCKYLQISANIFRELCGSKLSGLEPFDNMAIIHWVKNRLKAES